MLLSKLLVIFIGGVIGTLLRYFLCNNIKNKFFDGLFVSNIIGISYALIMLSITPLLIISFSGSLTSFSSLVKNSYENSYYLIVHVLMYMLLSIFLYQLI